MISCTNHNFSRTHQFTFSVNFPIFALNFFSNALAEAIRIVSTEMYSSFRDRNGITSNIRYLTTSMYYNNRFFDTIYSNHLIDVHGVDLSCEFSSRSNIIHHIFVVCEKNEKIKFHLNILNKPLWARVVFVESAAIANYPDDVTDSQSVQAFVSSYPPTDLFNVCFIFDDILLLYILFQFESIFFPRLFLEQSSR